MAIQNPLHDIPAKEKDAKNDVVNAIIEIPKDSNVKYELDKETGLLKMDRFLYSAVHYPGDYGFIPQTHWDDGDPLDIIVLTGRPLYPMTLAHIRVIGVLRMIDGNEKDDKIVGVYEHDPRFEEIQDLTDVPAHQMKELRHFFEEYKRLQGKGCKVPEVLSKDAALKDIERGMEMYTQKSNKQIAVPI